MSETHETKKKVRWRETRIVPSEGGILVPETMVHETVEASVPKGAAIVNAEPHFWKHDSESH